LLLSYRAEPFAAGQQEDIIGYLPGYAIPSISSLLPSFTNAEQDFINRTFSTGNYDFLKHLPDDIRHRQVGRIALHGWDWME